MLLPQSLWQNIHGLFDWFPVASTCYDTYSPWSWIGCSEWSLRMSWCRYVVNDRRQRLWLQRGQHYHIEVCHHSVPKWYFCQNCLCRLNNRVHLTFVFCRLIAIMKWIYWWQDWTQQELVFEQFMRSVFYHAKQLFFSHFWMLVHDSTFRTTT